MNKEKLMRLVGALDTLVIQDKNLWYNGEQEHSDVANLIYYIEELGNALLCTKEDL